MASGVWTLVSSIPPDIVEELRYLAASIVSHAVSKDRGLVMGQAVYLKHLDQKGRPTEPVGQLPDLPYRTFPSCSVYAALAFCTSEVAGSGTGSGWRLLGVSNEPLAVPVPPLGPVARARDTTFCHELGHPVPA